ncbi:MAG: hypothetical protein UZ14_CFX002003126 [Chloroflexi bacterium OLB14]|nr:MAG: hypothetical protein UZ14_CFX002003126 [Chloroflexi bacterium OLB14]
MDEDIEIQTQWTVDETLKRKPRTSLVFIKHHTQCVGCYLQKFCRISDVAEIYHLNLDEFLKKLNDVGTKKQE